MSNCYLGDHRVCDRTHMIKCNILEPQQKYRFGTVSNRFMGTKTHALCFCGGTKPLVRVKVFESIDESTKETRKSTIPKHNARRGCVTLHVTQCSLHIDKTQKDEIHRLNTFEIKCCFHTIIIYLVNKKCL